MRIATAHACRAVARRLAGPRGRCLSAAARDLAEVWSKGDPNPAMAAAAAAFAADPTAAAAAAWQPENRMKFGTAGLRGAMGPGPSCMNELTSAYATQGVLAHLEAEHGAAAVAERGVGIGYDHRAAAVEGISSERIALAAAHVLRAKGVKVYLYDRMVATPLVPWLVRARGCVGGIMITASHNPAQDNGYKLYWETGAQIISPHDGSIEAHIAGGIAKPLWSDLSEALATPESRAAIRSGCIEETEALATEYLDAVAAWHGAADAAAPAAADAEPRVVYTAMHGVGHEWSQRAFRRCGLPPFSSVPAQQDPDPTFPTVAFPNPEERGALKLATAHADSVGARVVVANDPDADRVAVAEKSGGASGTEWETFTGDEMGAVLGFYEIMRWKNANPGKPAGSAATLCSAVSSRFLGAIAAQEGIAHVETHTGFKWLGHGALDLAADGVDAIFAYEEAIGYCLGPTKVTADKDGVAGAAAVARMAQDLADPGGAAWLEKIAPRLPHPVADGGNTLRGLLGALREEYGHFVARNGYYFIEDRAALEGAFDKVRNGGAYMTHVAGKEVTWLRDLRGDGRDTRCPGNVPSLPTMPDAEMLTLELDGELTLTLRTSGTEPKLKFYSEIAGEVGVDRAKLAADLEKALGECIEELLDPEGIGLVAQSA